jgi:hypothetical protein
MQHHCLFHSASAAVYFGRCKEVTHQYTNPAVTSGNAIKRKKIPKPLMGVSLTKMAGKRRAQIAVTIAASTAIPVGSVGGFNRLASSV